jgi:hypothetical protein
MSTKNKTKQRDTKAKITNLWLLKYGLHGLSVIMTGVYISAYIAQGIKILFTYLGILLPFWSNSIVMTISVLIGFLISYGLEKSTIGVLHDFVESFKSVLSLNGGFGRLLTASILGAGLMALQVFTVGQASNMIALNFLTPHGYEKALKEYQVDFKTINKEIELTTKQKLEYVNDPSAIPLEKLKTTNNSFLVKGLKRDLERAQSELARLRTLRQRKVKAMSAAYNIDPNLVDNRYRTIMANFDKRVGLYEIENRVKALKDTIAETLSKQRIMTPNELIKSLDDRVEQLKENRDKTAAKMAKLDKFIISKKEEIKKAIGLSAFYMALFMVIIQTALEIQLYGKRLELEELDKKVRYYENKKNRLNTDLNEARAPRAAQQTTQQAEVEAMPQDNMESNNRLSALSDEMLSEMLAFYRLKGKLPTTDFLTKQLRKSKDVVLAAKKELEGKYIISYSNRTAPTNDFFVLLDELKDVDGLSQTQEDTTRDLVVSTVKA